MRPKMLTSDPARGLRPSWRVSLFVATLYLSAAAAAAQSDEPIVVPLWAGAVPDETEAIGDEYVRKSPALERKFTEVTTSTEMVTNVSRPSISIYQPPRDKSTDTAMVICPGGGYWNLYWEVEGEEVAEWLNQQGMTGIILKYRVPRRKGEPERLPASRPLQDVQRAISLVRSRAKEWGINENRIGVVGFSAGGHLAIAAATNFESRAYPAADEIDKVSCRPDFAVPVYSGYLKVEESDELAPGIKVPENTPPVFLVHGGDDIISRPEHSVIMYMALRKANIPAELHIYSGSTHGFGVRRSERLHSAWTNSCVDWLTTQGLLEKK